MEHISGFPRSFRKNATRLGADAVIMSVHKTLPAFTQTALLHLCSDRIAEKRLRSFWGFMRQVLRRTF